MIDVSPVLDEVERRLDAQVASSNRFVDETARYLAAAGGKRFRPMLVALAGNLGPSPELGRLADGGVVVELIHLATLYHDDVMDDAAARRGAVAAHVRWDNTVAILTGDYLFARAAELAADLGAEPTRIVARTIATLVEGQIREVQGSRALPPEVPRLEPDVDHYLAVISEKTASLVETSCRFGALLAGCGPAQIDAAARFGWNLGMAFQLSDDILDLASPPEVSGKVQGTDLRQGVRTLPVIYAVDDDPAGELRHLLDVEEPSEDDVARALELLRVHPALDRAREEAARYARDAVACLEAFPRSSASRALRHIADYTVVRTS